MVEKKGIIKSQNQSLESAKSWGFNVSPYSVLVKTVQEVYDFVSHWESNRYSLPFEIEFNLTNAQIIYLSLMCFIMLPIPFIVMTIAPKYTPAYQVYLIFLLEISSARTANFSIMRVSLVRSNFLISLISPYLISPSHPVLLGILEK
mgnify:CR=1 FL=1